MNPKKITEQIALEIKENKPNVWKMYLYKDALNFLNYIYQDSNFKYLTRKYNTYEKVSLL